MGHPYSSEDGSVINSYICLLALPEPALSGPSPTELMSIFYRLIWDSPRRSVGQSVLVSGTHLGPATKFTPFYFNYLLTVTDLLMRDSLPDEKSGL
jgi:hypothetical protein